MDPRGREAREFFAKSFSRFLRENFQSVRQIARSYGVDDRTAEYWLAGEHVPNGVVVGISFGLHPESAMCHLRLVVDNPPPAGKPVARAVPAGRKAS